jgi:hypothetical protein
MNIAWLNMYGTMVIEFEDNASTVKKSYWMYIWKGGFRSSSCFKTTFKKRRQNCICKRCFWFEIKNFAPKKIGVQPTNMSWNKYGIEE